VGGASVSPVSGGGVFTVRYTALSVGANPFL
jgi:hypothetical protein